MGCVHVHAQYLSHVRLFETRLFGGTVAHQAPPLTIKFLSQEYSSGLPFPPPGNLPNPRIQPKSPGSPTFQVDSLPLSHQGSPDRLRLSSLHHNPIPVP